MEQPAIDFSCGVCGADCNVAPDPPERAVCPNCCEDHDYQYDRDNREHRCVHCDQSAPDDWYSEENWL